MARSFLENFRQRGSSQENYNEGWERVFGNKKKKVKCPECDGTKVVPSPYEGVDDCNLCEGKGELDGQD